MYVRHFLRVSVKMFLSAAEGRLYVQFVILSAEGNPDASATAGRDLIQSDCGQRTQIVFSALALLKAHTESKPHARTIKAVFSS